MRCPRTKQTRLEKVRPRSRMPSCCSRTQRRCPQLLRAHRQRLRQTRAASSLLSTFPNGPATGRCPRFHHRHALSPARHASAESAGERTTAAPRDDSRLDPSALVEETWSRWAEWGMNLMVVGGLLTVLVLLVYFVFGQEFYGLAFRSSHGGIAGRRRARVPDADHARASGSGHARAGPARLSMARYRTTCPISAGCGCC